MLFSRRGAETLRKAKSFTLQGSFFPLRLCASARYIFCSSPAKLLHRAKTSKCFSPAEALGRREQRLKAFKHLLLLSSPLRPCASARYIFYSSPSRLLHPVKATKCLFSRRGAEALRGTTRHYKCGISFSIIVPVFRCSLRPCASARECSCSFSSLVTA